MIYEAKVAIVKHFKISELIENLFIKIYYILCTARLNSQIINERRRNNATTKTRFTKRRNFTIFYYPDFLCNTNFTLCRFWGYFSDNDDETKLILFSND